MTRAQAMERVLRHVAAMVRSHVDEDAEYLTAYNTADAKDSERLTTAAKEVARRLQRQADRFGRRRGDYRRGRR